MLIIARYAAAKRIIRVHTLEWGPAKAAKSYYGWSVTSGPPSKVSTLVKAKFCMVKEGRAQISGST